MKGGLGLVRGTFGWHAGRARTSGGQQETECHRPYETRTELPRPVHCVIFILRTIPKKVASRIPDTLSLNQGLGDGTFGGLCRFFRFSISFQESPLSKKTRKANSPSALGFGCSRCSYCFLIGFFGVRLAGAFFASPSRPPMRLKASAALNGNWRTEVSV